LRSEVPYQTEGLLKKNHV